jgi:hypothetical protein
MPSLAQIGSKNSAGMAPFCRIPLGSYGELSQQATATILHLGTEAGAARFGLSPESNPNKIKRNPTGSWRRQLKAPRKFPEKSELTPHVQR